MKKIIIITHAPQGTLGDPSSAAKLQQCIISGFLKYNEPIDVKVVIDVKPNYVEPVKKLFQNTMSYQILNGFDESTLIPEIANADLIILYPTPHFFDYSSTFLIGKAKKRVLALGEYDIDLEYQHQCRSAFFYNVFGSIFLSTGVGEKNIGIYLNENHPSGKHLFALLHPEDLFKLPQDLKQGKGLYFGYFNKIADSCTGATPARFIAFAAHNSVEQKEIDIILPLQPKDVINSSQESTMKALVELDFIEQLQGFNQVLLAYYPTMGSSQYLIYHPNERKYAEINKEEFEQQQHLNIDKIIRVFNPFPLQQQSIEALIEVSEPVNLLTGDQSISEALSFAKIPFYQAMPWKKNFNLSLQNVAEKKSLTTLLHWFELINDKNLPTTVLTNFYKKHQEVLKQEIQCFRDYLLLEKKLSDNITAFIRSMLTMSTYDLFKEFINNIKQNFNYYISERGANNTAIVGSMALLEHVQFYLDNANGDEKVSIITYLLEHIDEIVDLKSESMLHLISKLKRRYVDITISLSYPLLLNILCAESISHESTLSWHGVSPFLENNRLLELKKKEHELLKKPVSDINNMLLFFELMKESQCTPKEKINLLQLIMDNLICYVSYFSADEIALLTDLIIHETSPEVLRELFSFLFLTPCYQDTSPSILYDNNKPSPYFQIPENKRLDFLIKILAHPFASALLFSLDPQSIHSILDDLLFSNTYNKQNSFWVESGKWPKPELINQFLSIDSYEKQLLIKNYLASTYQAHPYKRKIIINNIDYIPPYLKEFMNPICSLDNLVLLPK